MDFVLSASSNLPTGATVKVFTRSTFPTVPLVPQGAPPGSGEVFSGTMGASSLTVTGLTSDTRYVAYASVGGEHRYVQFRSAATDPDQTLDSAYYARAAYRRNGVVWETASRRGKIAQSLLLTTGKEYVTAVWLPAGLPTTGMAFAFVGSDSTANPTHLWYSLRDASLGLLQYTADSTARPASGTMVEQSWNSAATYVVPESGLYYVGLGIVQGTGTMPSIMTVNGNAAINGLSPVLAATTADTISTGTPPSTAGALTAIAGQAYCELLG